MAEQEIQELKNKLQAQAMQFENYKTQCKQLEQFLEEESNKKQDEIRKLKQESIKKQKNYSLLKTQVSQMQSEIANLKAQLKQKQGQISSTNSNQNAQHQQKIKQLQQQLKTLTTQKNTLKQRNTQLQKKVTELETKNNDKDNTDNNQLENRIKQLESNIKKRDQIIKDLQLDITKAKKNISPSKNQKKQQKNNMQQKSGSKVQQKPVKNQYTQEIKNLNHKLVQSRLQTEKAEKTAIKLSKQLKQLKQKMNHLSVDRQKLSKKVKQLSSMVSKNKKQQHIRQDTFQEEEIIEHYDSQPISLKDSLTMSALIMTKKHYVSPFLQFKGENMVKLYRSTKNGCFEKSLGSLKFKLNQITYETQNIVSQCVKAIQQNLNNQKKTSIIFYGAKKTSKKYLMADVVGRLKQTLSNLIDSAQDQPRAQFVKSSVQTQKKAQFQGKDREQVMEVIDRVIALGQKNPKNHEAIKNKKKGTSKPKVRLFSFGIGQENLIQIITTSHTNIYSRQNSTIFDALNNICYSKLPNSLQPVDAQKILILTVNPIVSLYEDCRNTLSIAQCKKIIHNQSSSNLQWQGSPIKDDMLNDTARKKIENIERDNEQNSLKVRKLQEDIYFYRNKFDQLEVRLKNLLNTHGGQNSYLKKSPVTLSYEKMLKFVHSVLARNGPSLVHSPIMNKASDFHETFQMDDDYASGQQIL